MGLLHRVFRMHQFSIPTLSNGHLLCLCVCVRVCVHACARVRVCVCACMHACVYVSCTSVAGNNVQSIDVHTMWKF